MHCQGQAARAMFWQAVLQAKEGSSEPGRCGAVSLKVQKAQGGFESFTQQLGHLVLNCMHLLVAAVSKAVLHTQWCSGWLLWCRM